MLMPTVLGVFLGAIIGFLLRPSVPLLGQLPFSVVITRGSELSGVDRILQATAQQSFNYVLAGAMLGGVVKVIFKRDRPKNSA